MKRAWPYALALAVVVTGCYLALTPLLRSLNPGPTGTAASQPLPGASTTTVPQATKQPAVKYTSDNPGFTSLYKSTAKKKAKKSSKTTKKVTPTPVFVSPTTSSPSNSTSTTTPSTSTTTPPASTTSTTHTSSKPKTTKAASNTGTRAPINGTINQSDNGGFAGQGQGDSTLPPAGKTSTVVGG